MNTTYQEVLLLVTERPWLRAEAVGWTHESGALAQRFLDQHVGMIRSPIPSSMPSPPLHALGAGWRLLAPPQDPTVEGDGWVWWFVREVAP